MGCNYCNDRVGGRRDDDRRDNRRDDRFCCDWDKFLFGDRRRCNLFGANDDRRRCGCDRDNVRGAEDRNRGCRGRRDDVMGAEDNRRNCGCKKRHRNCFCNLFW
ncbi:hypothetical protein [Rossellomorea vietnamensis]|uniref:hypothetical protein n=1 Tax=Rossellomorea vietnamensis TaxID=218284 RepID=UPI00309383E6|nr:hypothetical protein Q7C14_19540 [Rossellomorea vietnamensis]